MVSGAIFAGFITTEALFPHTFDKWFLPATRALLIGGFALILTLILNPEGIAGTDYKKKQEKKKRLAAGGREPRSRPRLRSRAGRPAPAAEEAGALRPSRDRISVSFGGVRAVVDVDLDVNEGQLLGLIGPNGAGKTTFIDAISGFVRCRGRVELDGRDLSSACPRTPARGVASRAPGSRSSSSTT